MEKHVDMELSKITENIYVGTNMCCNMHFQKLNDFGFDIDIDLEEERQEHPEKVKIYLWLPTTDKTAPTLKQLKAGVALIDQAVNNNEKVYVHCMNGHGRAPTLVAAYFIYHHKMMVNEAIDLVKQKRPEIHLEPAQIDMLEDYKKYCQDNVG